VAGEVGAASVRRLAVRQRRKGRRKRRIVCERAMRATWTREGESRPPLNLVRGL
jgi:hypothetical protein